MFHCPKARVLAFMLPHPNSTLYIFSCKQLITASFTQNELTELNTIGFPHPCRANNTPIKSWGVYTINTCCMHACLTLWRDAEEEIGLGYH